MAHLWWSVKKSSRLECHNCRQIFFKIKKWHMFHPPQWGHHIPMFWITEIQNPWSSLVQTCMFSGRALRAFFFWPSWDSRGSFPSTLLQKEGRKRENDQTKVILSFFGYESLLLLWYLSCFICHMWEDKDFCNLYCSHVLCTSYYPLSSPTIVMKTIQFSTAPPFSRGLPLFSVFGTMKWGEMESKQRFFHQIKVSKIK